MITVKIAPLNGRVVEVSLEEGATIADALEASGIDAGDREIRQESLVVDEDAPVANGAIIQLLPKVKGA